MPSYEYDNRPMALTSYISNQSGHPLGLHADWAAEKETFIYDLLTYSSFNNQLDRVVIWQPAGRQKDCGLVGVSSWWMMTDKQKEIMRNGIQQWKKEKIDRKVGIYISAYSNYSFSLNCSSPLQPDKYNPKALREFLQNTLPFINIGVDEFWLDAGSQLELMPEMINLEKFFRLNYGIKIGVEAIPIVNVNGTWKLNEALLKHVPVLAYYSFFVSNLWGQGINIQLPALTGLEAHCIMLKGLPDNPYAGWPMPTADDFKKLKDAGYILSWADGQIFPPATTKPPQEPSGPIPPNPPSGISGTGGKSIGGVNKI